MDENEIYNPMSEDLRIDREMLDKKVGEITLRDLIKIFVLIKKGKNPKIVHDIDIRNNIIKVLQEQGPCTMYDIAKILKIPYQNIRYHMDKLEDSNTVRGNSIVDENKRTKIIFTLLTHTNTENVEEKRDAEQNNSSS